MTEHDPVNHPQHYTQVPGVECIDVVQHFSFLRGNAIKYLWRAGAKGDLRQDLEKARWYIVRELAQLEPSSSPSSAGSAVAEAEHVVEPEVLEAHVVDEQPAPRPWGAGMQEPVTPGVDRVFEADYVQEEHRG